ncbi:MAG: hypothetical protein A3K65_06850 [Euryarchaeota archaeon RBG_16_68_12]|nr:MAG: hypothetical protein A3K65_06850 [Euryarchaeota archaeon RBG_16_68_12]
MRWEWTVTGPGGTWTFNTSVAAFTPPSAGTYNATLRVWDVAGGTSDDSALITVVGPAGPVGVADWTWLLIGVAVVVLSAAVLVVLVRRRRKGEAPPEGKGPPPPSSR